MIDVTKEDDNQELIFNWCRGHEEKYPELKLLHHIPNEGFRTKAYAVALQRRGVKAGVPDMFLPVPRGSFHGLYIELKVGKNKPTEKQLWWLDQLTKQGYMAVVRYGFRAAIETIENYLKGEEHEGSIEDLKGRAGE